MSQTLLGAGALFIAHAVVAAPPVTVPFSNNETLDVKLSSVDINRLVVKDDKITSVTCPTGFCTLPMSDSASQGADPSGAALVALNVQEPFTFYVSTQKGQSFGVFVKPLAIPAVTTQFISMTTTSHTQREEAAKFEKQSPYEAMLVTLMKSMMNWRHTQALPNRFIATPLTVVKEKKPTVIDGLTLTPTVNIRGDALSGVIYRVKNNSDKRVTVKPTNFYAPNVVAVSLSASSIPPYSTIELYQITQRGQ